LKQTLIYGKHPILEAFDSGNPIEKIFVQQNAHGDWLVKIRSLAEQSNIPLQTVPLPKLNRLTRNNHQGIVGILSHIQYYYVEDILPSIYERGEIPLFLLLDGITDVRNFGAIARTALGMGVHAIVIPKKGAASINADAIKTSAGALNKLPVCREKNLLSAVRYLQLNGITLVAADARGTQELAGCDLTVPTGIVIGSEDTGIEESIIRRVDEMVKIPISEKLESYNVSVSAGIILYETQRQRNKSQ
jgi:23S rRNA (guanosine2251-2'-O)-methyltransferase